MTHVVLPQPVRASRKLGRLVGPNELLLVLGLVCGAAPVAHAAIASFPEFRDPNPATGNGFGTHVVFLSTGNVVITSPYDDFYATDAGAVYVFNAANGVLVSTLRGITAGDHVGSGGVTALTNGNFVVGSPDWDNSSVVDAGAATFGNGTTGISGTINSANSLVGSTASDNVGAGAAVALPNGNYIVVSPLWDNGIQSGAGAVTFCNGATGLTGPVSAANSLVGSTTLDLVGNGGVTVLPSGNYVVRSQNWHNGGLSNAGAVTWGSGTTGRVGAVSASNSLVGSAASDIIGSSITVLANGNYVVMSANWDNGATVDAGAVTWCNGSTGRTGVLSGANSFVGAATGDYVGSAGVAALTNGHYVIRSPNCDIGGVSSTGAVTWGNGNSGIVGTLSSANSLVGSTTSDAIGNSGLLTLSNGNYVVLSNNWNNGAIVDAGAATWCNGSTGRTGAVSAVNSVVGATANDFVGNSGIALTNGNYVILSFLCDIGGVANVGAATWCDGATGRTGAVTAANSLVGSSASDQVGGSGAVALTNGNFVVRSPSWKNAGTATGAFTWCDGTTGRTGAVSVANSLVGSHANDGIGSSTVLALPNGHYVVALPMWDNGSVVDAGAVTFGNGTNGIAGIVSIANSLVGSTTSDEVGLNLKVLANGNYLAGSQVWDNGAVIDAGGIAWCSGTAPTTGALGPNNALVGASTGDVVGISTTALTSGDYVVRVPNWDYAGYSDLGAAVWGSGASGVNGYISPANAVIGAGASTALATITEDTVHGTFTARFSNEAGGRVRLGPGPFLAIANITDVPSDQGGYVYVNFGRHALDHIFADPAIASYGVWRRIPSAAAAPSSALSEGQRREARALFGQSFQLDEIAGALVVNSTGATGSLPAGNWALVASVPALQQNSYSALVPTISNAAPNDFVVTAHPTMPALWASSAVASGQSVDNLAPAMPQPFAGAYASGTTHLTWGANPEHDLAGYRLYRGSSPSFTPTLANRIATPTGTSFDDATAGGYVYKLTAVDVNGNESPVAVVTPSGTTGVNEGPVVFALSGVHPNPARGHALQIAFALPSAASARLELLDVSGRRVVSREVGALGAGAHVVNLAEARAIPAGLYWARLTQGASQRSVRVAVVE